MGSWEKFNETSIPPKELFCSELNLEDITNEDYAHVQTVWDVFEIKIRDKVIHYCLQMYLKTLEVSVLKYMDLILLIFFVSTWISMAILFRKNRSKFRIINRY